MDHDLAERLISERIDGERLARSTAAALESHLETCDACQAFERGAYRLRETARFQIVPAVPDLVEPIMASVREEALRRPPRLRLVRPPGQRPRPRRARLPRLAPAVAAMLVGALAGSLVVGGPWRDRPAGSPALAAAEVTRGVAGAATRLHSYQARFEITEHHLSPEVPLRELSMSVWFEAPERFRLEVTDHTTDPTLGTPTDLKLIVDGPSWYSAGPAPCASTTCPQRETVVTNRVPFSRSAPVPTDLVLPLTALASDEGLRVLGRGSVLGRPAVQVELTFERAAPLFPFLQLGGEWRPFHPNDRVRLWLDERSWFPLRWEVFPASGRARDAWALRFGLPEEPSRRAIFEVEATEVDLTPPAPDVFAIPDTGQVQDQGARTVTLGDVESRTGFEPLTPGEVVGLRLYRVVVPATGAEVEPARSLIAYANGLSFLNLAETRGWSGDVPFGPVGLHAEEVSLSSGGVAYFEPATPDQARRLSIHGFGTDLYLESNLPRDDLLAVAASLPVVGLRMPEAWRVRLTPDGVIERASLDEAAVSVPFALDQPTSLPPGFALASVELVRTRGRVGVTLYYQDAEFALGAGPVRFHIEEGDRLPPPSASIQLAVEVRGVAGRFTPEFSRLEWVSDGVYRSVDAPGLGLSELLSIAVSIMPTPRTSIP